MKVFVLVLGVLAVVHSTPVSHDENVLKTVIGSISECVNSDVDICLKVRREVHNQNSEITHGFYKVVYQPIGFDK